MLALWMTTVVVALTADAFAAGPPPPIAGGDLSTGHDAVGAFVADNGSMYGAFCSGTLVDEVDVLTAAHCVSAMVEYDRQGYAITFVTGTDITSSSGIDTQTRVISAVQHPDYTETPELSADIAVARLSTKPAGVTPIPLNEAAPTDAEWTFSTLKHVGWGATEVSGTGAGLKREATLEVADYGPEFLFTIADDGSNVCVGDSGGAALGRSESGAWVVVGVNAFVFDPEGGPPICEGGAAGSTRVDAFMDFVDAMVEGDDSDGSGGWSNFEIVPEDASGSIIGDSKAGCSALVSSGSAGAIGILVGLVGVARRRQDRTPA
jgi:secreted trypsin-like serine protease